MNKVLMAMRPNKLVNDTLIRLGRNYDGGYVVNKKSLECDVLYGYGVGSEITFDYDWWSLSSGLKVHLFDHTVDCPNIACNIQFHKQGLGPKKDGDLDNFLNVVDKDYFRILLKIDVECAEYDWLEATNMDDLAKVVETMVIEFHDLPRRQDRFVTDVERIRTQFDVVHVHGNNNAPMLDGIPQDAEVTFIRQSAGLTSGFAKVCYPLYGIDFPNTPAHPDITIDYTNV